MIWAEMLGSRAWRGVSVRRTCGGMAGWELRAYIVGVWEAWKRVLFDSHIGEVLSYCLLCVS